MNDAALAVEVLKNLRRHSAVRTPDGIAFVWCQVADKVTVQCGARVQVWPRWMVEVVK